MVTIIDSEISRYNVRHSTKIYGWIAKLEIDVADKEEPINYVDQKVKFLDPKHGFWRLGTCYKQEKRCVRVRDVGGKRSKVAYDEIELDKG